MKGRGPNRRQGPKPKRGQGNAIARPPLSPAGAQASRIPGFPSGDKLKKKLKKLKTKRARGAAGIQADGAALGRRRGAPPQRIGGKRVELNRIKKSEKEKRRKAGQGRQTPTPTPTAGKKVGKRKRKKKEKKTPRKNKGRRKRRPLGAALASPGRLNPTGHPRRGQFAASAAAALSAPTASAGFASPAAPAVSAPLGAVASAGVSSTRVEPSAANQEL